jgi:hypothetical protein
VNEGTGLAEALLGLDGFRMLEVSETPGEVVITVETAADLRGAVGAAESGRWPTSASWWRSATWRAPSSCPCAPDPCVGWATSLPRHLYAVGQDSSAAISL